MNETLSYTGTISLALSGIIYYYYKSSSAQYDSLQKARHSTIKQLPHLIQQHTQIASSTGYPSSPLYVCVEGMVAATAPLQTRWPSMIGNAASKAIGIYHVLTETSITTKLMPLSRLPWYDTEQPSIPDVHSVPFMLLDPVDRQSSVSLPALSTLSLPSSTGIESLLRYAGSHFVSSELKYDDAMQNFQIGAIPKGTRFDEQLIPIDTRMTVFGHATMENGTVRIGEYDFLHGISPTRPFFVSSLPYAHILHHAKQERSKYYYALVGTLLLSCSSYIVLGVRYGWSYYQTRQQMARLEAFRMRRRAAALKKRKKQQQQQQQQQQQAQQALRSTRPLVRRVRRRDPKSVAPISSSSSSSSVSVSASTSRPRPTLSRSTSTSTSASTSTSTSASRRYDDDVDTEEKEGYPSPEGRRTHSRRVPLPLPSAPPSHARSSSRSRVVSDPHDETDWEATDEGEEWEEWEDEKVEGSDEKSLVDHDIDQDEDEEEPEISSDDAETMCVICLHQRADAVMLDCGHMYTCVTCADKCAKCPVCRASIKRVVKVFSNA